MADQVQWIPTSNEPVVIHYVTDTCELLAPDMPSVNAELLALASELIGQHCRDEEVDCG